MPSYVTRASFETPDQVTVLEVRLLVKASVQQHLHLYLYLYIQAMYYIHIFLEELINLHCREQETRLLDTH